jgi:acrylyl-CoA reductase (NADPH)
MSEKFSALVVDRDGDDTSLGLRRMSMADLPEGAVTVAVEWSSANYKDALAVRWDGKVARNHPLVPGIDLAGTVIDSTDSAAPVGGQVIVHGYDLGVARHGGYAERARVPADWVVPLPDGLTARDAMAIGTAGFTAALSVIRLQDHGIVPDAGPVLVTGATGGVGSVAVDILAGLGYEVVASTGKADAHDLLRGLGASEVIDRLPTEAGRPLESQRWAAAVDSVGGGGLGHVLRTLKYGGVVAASGLTGGIALPATVMPFILRGVTLAGIDSVQLAIGARREVWRRLSGDLRPPHLTEFTNEVALADVPEVLSRLHASGHTGRTVVAIG